MSDKQIALHAKKNPGGRPTERGESKRAPISMRTTPSIRAALEEAADREGRSLAQEIEQRLERSVAEEQVRGGPHNVRLLDAIAAEVATIETITGESWNKDQVTFHLILLAIPEMLHQHAPPILNSEAVAQASAAYSAAKADRDAVQAYLASIGAWALPAPDVLASGMFGRTSNRSSALIAGSQAVEGLGARFFGAAPTLEQQKDEYERRVEAMYKRTLVDENGHVLSEAEKDSIADAIRSVRELDEVVNQRRHAFMEAYDPQMKVVQKAAERFKAIREARLAAAQMTQNG